MSRTAHGSRSWRRWRSARASSWILLTVARLAYGQDSPTATGRAIDSAAPLGAGAPPAEAPASESGERVLTLAEALRGALARHPRLAVSNANLAAAEARVAQARAPLLPELGANGSYTRATANLATRNGPLPDASSRSYNAFSFGVSANQLVTDFGQTLGRLHVAEASRDAQRSNSEADRQQLRLDVYSAYFAARAQKALLRVAEETLANQDRHLASVSGFVEIGTRPTIDRVQAQADRQRAELKRINADNDYAIAKARLLQTIGVDAPIPFDVSDDTLAPVTGEDGPSAVLYAQALAARPDLRAALDALRAQERSVDASRAGYYPSLNVSAGLTEAGPELDRMRWNASAGALFSWQIFEGGATRAAVHLAHANVDAASAQATLLRQQLLLEVEQARIGVVGAKHALSTAELVVGSSRERLTLAEGRYQTGVGSLLELADAQLALTQAQGDRVQAEFSLASARAALLHALGRQ